MKGKDERKQSEFSDMLSSRVEYLYGYWRLNGKPFLSFSSMPPTMGWLAYLGPSYRCTCPSGYTDLEWILSRACLMSFSRH